MFLKRRQIFAGYDNLFESYQVWPSGINKFIVYTDDEQDELIVDKASSVSEKVRYQQIDLRRLQTSTKPAPNTSGKRTQKIRFKGF